MSAIESLRSGLSRLRKQLDEAEPQEQELEALFNDTDALIKQLTELRGRMFAKLYTMKATDLIKKIEGEPA